jgi:hypothetical protein
MLASHRGYEARQRQGQVPRQACPILNDDLGQDFGPFLYGVCVNACYICMGSSELHTLREAFTAAGGRWSDYLVGAKSHFTLGRPDYQRQYEPILYGWKDGSDHYWCGARDQGDVWFFRQAGSE